MEFLPTQFRAAEINHCPKIAPDPLHSNERLGQKHKTGTQAMQGLRSAAMAQIQGAAWSASPPYLTLAETRKQAQVTSKVG